MRRTRRHALLPVLAATLATLGAVAAAPGSAAARRASRGWDEPVLVSATQGSLEVSLAINPRDERQLAMCAPSGVPAVHAGQSYFHRSVDAGRRWALVDVETAPADTRGAAFEGGDCDVAYDAGGTLWVADTWAGNLSIGHSRDGRAFEGSAVTTPVPVVDRPWLVGGPPGTLYVTYQDAQCCMPSVVWLTKTTDYGRTFTPPVPVTTGTAETPYTWQGNLAVAPGGRDLYLVHSRRSFPLHVPGRETIALAASHDGGGTWTTSDIAELPALKTSLYPGVAVDAGGHVHAVWSATHRDTTPAFYTTSRDRGASWSRPRPLNAGASAYGAWVAGGRTGQARVAWLGTHPTTGAGKLYFGYAKVDRGRTVSGGVTTTSPVGDAHQVPEFVTVRLDRQGRMHLAMTVPREPRPGDGFVSPWTLYYQRESRGR